MSNVRLIARLDIKGPNLIKGVRLEGLRVMGDPNVFARQYYEDGADEILYMDTVASLYERKNITEIVRKTAQDVFIPITVGGGIRSLEDATTILRAGADKVAINTAAIQRPGLITDVAKRFGAQCMVLSIEAKRIAPKKWEAYYNNGRDHSGLDVFEWIREGIRLGAGEILLTSVDQEGTQKGFEVELVRLVNQAVSVPVIVSGGMGNLPHLTDVIQNGNASAVAMAHVLHYKKTNFREIRAELIHNGIAVRTI